MIVETLIASVTAITVAGTWLGLRFAERELHPEDGADKRRAAALDLVRRVIAGDVSEAKLRALLVAAPEDLPDDVRARATSWLQTRSFEVPKKLGEEALNR